jgi:hypothetical protein
VVLPVSRPAMEARGFERPRQCITLFFLVQALVLSMPR